MRLLSSLLFGVNPFDPMTYVAVTCALAVWRWWPRGCRRASATRIDPMLALRSE